MGGSRVHTGEAAAAAGGTGRSLPLGALLRVRRPHCGARRRPSAHVWERLPAAILQADGQGIAGKGTSAAAVVEEAAELEVPAVRPRLLMRRHHRVQDCDPAHLTAVGGGETTPGGGASD